MKQYAFDADALLSSFRSAGGWYHEDKFRLDRYTGMGYGGKAKVDIPPHTPLFHIPLDLLLTPYTSRLRSHLSIEEWESIQGGWAPLILCMMYETSLGSTSQWAGYLSNMPSVFHTPMFWSEEERGGLRGTDIEHRIGKEDAEKDYQDKVVPILRAHLDLFSSTSNYFSLDAYHLQGSRILSRSFTIPLSRAGGPSRTPPAMHTEEDDDSDDHEEEEEEMIAVMVPMADMLNAGYEMDNARLFGDGDEDEENDAGGEMKEVEKKFGEGYTMISTKVIKAGEQIYNTYSSPPNAELLRKYGHVDTLPLPATLLDKLTPEEIGDWPYGNPGDEVEIEGDKVLEAIFGMDDNSSVKDRIDWWLEDGQDDTFGMTFETPIDDGLISFIRLLTVEKEWERAERKGKLPNPTLDEGVIEVLQKILKNRLARYETSSISEDLQFIKSSDKPSPKRNAAILRIGEKRLIRIAERFLESSTQQLATDAIEEKKRKSDHRADEVKGKRQKSNR